MMATPFAVTILWGESPEDGQNAITYRFATEAELVAFKDGINEANGWFDSAEVSEGDVWCAECDSAHQLGQHGTGEDDV
jgi:hypothetical protein